MDAETRHTLAVTDPSAFRTSSASSRRSLAKVVIFVLIVVFVAFVFLRSRFSRKSHFRAFSFENFPPSFLIFCKNCLCRRQYFFFYFLI